MNREQQAVMQTNMNKAPASQTEAYMQHELTRLTGENFDLREKIENLNDTVKRLKKQLWTYRKKVAEAGGAVDLEREEREESGEEEEGAEGSKVEGAEGSKVETEKKAEADKNTSEGSSTDKKPVKEKTKTAEKRGRKRSGEEPCGGGRPQKVQKMHKAPGNGGAIGMSTASRENKIWSGAR